MLDTSVQVQQALQETQHLMEPLPSYSLELQATSHSASIRQLMASQSPLPDQLTISLLMLTQQQQLQQLLLLQLVSVLHMHQLVWVQSS